MRRLVVTVFAAFAALAVSCDPPPTSPDPPRPTLVISPNPVPALRVGQTLLLAALLHGAPAANPSFVTWTSSSSAVASVGTSTGLVQCLAAGSTVITARASEFNVNSGSLEVTCNAFFTVTPDTLAFTHTVRVSPCPQPAGTIRVTNTSGQTLTVVVTSSNAALQTDVSFVTLAAGASRDVAVAFNCGTQVSFTSTIAFSAVIDSITENKQVGVTATIIR